MIAGIDLGIQGAIVIIDSRMELTIYDTPVIQITKGKKVTHDYDDKAIHSLFFCYSGLIFAVMEAPGMRPGQSTQSAMKVGTGYGIWRGILAANSIGYQVVHPATWKKEFGLTGQDKNASRLMAKKLYPQYSGLFDRVKDDGRAEAALLATYGIRKGWNK